jgi:phosphonate transport system permease protein
MGEIRFMPASAETLEARYPELFLQGGLRRHLPLIVLAGLVLYMIYAAWFFSLPSVLGGARWDRLGNYLSQWVSYDVSAEFRLDGDAIEPRWPRFSVLGSDPHPDWIVADIRGTRIELAGPAASPLPSRTPRSSTTARTSQSISPVTVRPSRAHSRHGSKSRAMRWSATTALPARSVSASIA